ncbi:S8 family serine peptidase [Arthrobacter sp. NPDC089319]|uniref:S8 family serine peptidase n=1 Tax=Arthrobacter sp. NPDC089319 TaxID=3155915 RepID=UPI003434CCDB
MEAGGDRFIVKFRATAEASAAERDSSYREVAADAGVALEELHTTADGAGVIEADRELTAVEANELLKTLSARPDVEYAEQDVLMYPAYNPNDTYYKQQWSFADTKAGLALPEAWHTTTGKGSVVAVIDTGLTRHSDLEASVLPGADLISDPDISRDGDGRDQDPLDNGDWCDESGSDSSWHGTHVAGIVAAVAGNGRGVAGAAPGAKIVPVRALGACLGWMSDIADAVIWAAGGGVDGMSPNQNPADVINLSLGGTGACDSTMQDAINFAVSKGSTVVVAAGNEAEPAKNFSPASCNAVVTVAASGPTGDRADYSNYGAAVDVTAPGGDTRFVAGGIPSTVNTGTTVPAGEGYAILEGTSMAAPHVASVAALLKSANPLLSPAQIEAVLKNSARPIARCSRDCGAGLVSALAAVGSVLPKLMSETPIIVGTGAIGSVLYVTPGTWSPQPVLISYQWFRDGSAIPGAIGASYRLSSHDLGSKVSVRVTGSKSGYMTSVRQSAGIMAGVLTTAAPKITGNAKVGNSLKATAGPWTLGTTLKYQWLRNGSPIYRATGINYALTATDVGKSIKLRISGAKSGYATAARESAAVSVAAGTLATSTPKITGAAKVGKKLTAKAGTWTSGTHLKYRWYRSGKAIKGATSQTYTLVSADRYDRITVKVTGTKAGYAAAAKTSAKTSKVAAGTLKSVKPKISGTAKVGKKLTAKAGTWTSGTKLKYQWYRSAKAIKGATSKTYKLVSADRGDRISVKVTGTKTGYNTTSKVSANTRKI